MSDEKKVEALQPFVPQNLEQLDVLARRLSQSKLIPKALQGQPADVAVILLTGHELGLTPMQSIRSINCVDGKGVLAADLMAALVLRSPACEYLRLTKSTDEVATYETKRRDSDPVQLSYFIAQAQKAGLARKDNWVHHPAAMLRARCVSSIVRSVYPDLMHGIYEQDEAREIREQRGEGNHGEVIDVTERQDLDADLAGEAQRIIEEIGVRFSVEAVRELVIDIRKLPKAFQLRIKPVFDARIAAIESGEVADPEPEMFDQPPTEEPADIGASHE
jgi:hypothetical protein